MVKSFLASILVSSALAINPGPFPLGPEGSGYGCDRACNAGDKNYVIKAKIETYNMKNSGKVTLPQKLSPDGNDIAIKTRTFVGDSSRSDPFCQNGYNGTSGVLAPCLTVNPGETINILVVNEIGNGMAEFNQVPADRKQFFGLIDSIPAGILPGPRAASFEDLNIVSEENMPGLDVSFDTTNIHLHGLHIIPHMFYPLGTADPDADWITIMPATEDPSRQCFCYVFELPEDHPQGTYFWHIHRHGSATMQGWQGMFGYLFVGDENSKGSPFEELASYDIRWEPLAFWEMFANVTNVFSTSVNDQTLAAGQYIETHMHENNPTEQQFFYPVNNGFFPEIAAKVNEVVMMPLLNAQASVGMAFYILDESNNLVDFYKFASDGVSYGPNTDGTSVYKQNMLILGPAQRDNILLKFTKAGSYSVMNHRITPRQLSDAYPNGYSDQFTHLGATIVVAGKATTDIDPMELVFTAGIPTAINLTDVVRHTTVTFDIDIQQNTAPFAQFEVNNKMYGTNDTSNDAFKVKATTAERWTIASTDDVSHPFHIHVNPFQVTGIDVDSVLGTLEGISIADTWRESNLNPPFMWRDTAFVPPDGSVDLIQAYGGDTVAFAGKTVFHCHYLEHQDQGMIANLLINSDRCFEPSEACARDADCCGFDESESLCQDQKCVISQSGAEQTKVCVSSVLAFLLMLL